MRVADRVDHGAGLLHRPVLVEEHRHRRADAGLGERLEQRRQPARLDQRIAVQEAEPPAARELSALVRGGAEAEVRLVADDGSALDVLLDASERVVGRGVVDEDQLEAGLGVLGQRGDRAAGDLATAVEHHHDRDLGLLELRQRDLAHGFRRRRRLSRPRVGAV